MRSLQKKISGRLRLPKPHHCVSPVKREARSGQGRAERRPVPLLNGKEAMTDEELAPEEARRMVAWLRKELEHQRELNGEMRRAVAELARAFQESLARAHDAAESGEMDRVRRITIENRDAWQAYLQQIIEASKPKRVTGDE